MSYNLTFDERLTIDQLKDIIRHIKNKTSEYEKLQAYYMGDNTEITRRSRVNPIPIPYGRKIVNTVTGYMFKPGYIGYSTENEVYKELIDEVFYQNHEDEITSALGKTCSIYGVAYELHFLGVDDEGAAMPKFVSVSPMEMVAVYHQDLKIEDMACAVRLYSYGKEQLVDVYYPDVVQHFMTDNSGNIKIAQDEELHGYTKVPVVQYVNNEEEMGDFKPVLKLIDAYDTLMSDSVGEIEKLAEAYLVLTNQIVAENDVQEMRRRRIIELMEGGKAEFLTKNVSPELLKFMRDWIREEIHTQSQIPDMSDQSFAGTQSGIAIRYKLNDLENICSTKEIYFRKGLFRRLTILDGMMDELWTDVGDVREIEITFTRNIPMNYVEIAQIVRDLRGHISLQTLLEQVVPFVTSAQDEINRLKAETDPYAYLVDQEDEVDTIPNDTDE